MVYFSIAFFVLALVAALFGFALPADPAFAHFAQLFAGGFLVASLFVFAFDRMWGAWMLRRRARPTQSLLDVERARERERVQELAVPVHHQRPVSHWR